MNEQARCETNAHVWIVPPLNGQQGQPFEGQHCLCGRARWSKELRDAKLLADAVDLVESRLVEPTPEVEIAKQVPEVRSRP